MTRGHWPLLVTILGEALRSPHSIWTFEGVTSDPPNPRQSLRGFGTWQSWEGAPRWVIRTSCASLASSRGGTRGDPELHPPFLPAQSINPPSAPCHQDNDGRGKPPTRAPAGEPGSIPLQPADQGSRGSKAPLPTTDKHLTLTGVSQARSHCEVPSVPGRDIRPTRTPGTSQVLNPDSPTPQGPWMTCSRTPPTHTYEASPQDEPSVAGDRHGAESWLLTRPA